MKLDRRASAERSSQTLAPCERSEFRVDCASDGFLLVKECLRILYHEAFTSASLTNPETGVRREEIGEKSPGDDEVIKSTSKRRALKQCGWTTCDCVLCASQSRPSDERSRISTFMDESLCSSSEVPLRLSPGYSVIQSEICAFTTRSNLHKSGSVLAYSRIDFLAVLPTFNRIAQRESKRVLEMIL
ncbi:hypothetical protein ANCCEY_09491 [Ancylostoma ceylanicum]|uniref:Uncharacterized protein n=1 Tax=Ancylostoma ceylanicum TaxID=53326 RepID=A0A0D6LJS6_9BILA|nr:hypothetical protein ANCCEY_09491 [Ancylostoma ceylanicum]